MSKENKSMLIGFLSFAVLGAILLAAWTVMLFDYFEFIKTAEEATATITYIETYKDSDGDTEHRVFVKYYVGGQEYEVKISYWAITMAVGKTVNVLYNPNDPNDFRLDAFSYGWLFPVVGTLFLLTGIIPSIKILKRRSSKGKLRPKAS